MLWEMRSRWVVVASLVGLGGCDSLFNIEHIPDPDRGDARTIDAPPIDGAQLDAAVDAPEACPPGYMTIPNGPVGSTYRFVGSYDVWNIAEADCEKDTSMRVTHLVVLDDDAETAAVVAYLSQSPTHAGFARNVADDPQQFFAVTGAPVPLGSPPWGLNEPNNGGGGAPEPVTWFSYYGLVDGPTNYSLTYLCECDHQPVTKMFVLSPQ